MNEESESESSVDEVAGEEEILASLEENESELKDDDLEVCEHEEGLLSDKSARFKAEFIEKILDKIFKSWEDVDLTVASFSGKLES